MSVNIIINELSAGDSVAVFRSIDGEIDKEVSQVESGAQYGSSIVLDSNLDVDTPSTGVVRIVDDSLGIEYRIRFASWLDDTLTLKTKVTGTADAGGSSTVLVDADGAFLSKGLKIGDIVVNETTGGHGYVEGTLNTMITLRERLSTGIWGAGDIYSFHVLPVLLDTADTVYIPYIDIDDDSLTMETISVTYSNDRETLTRIRRAGILPIDVVRTLTSSGLTVYSRRVTDTIVS